MAEELQYSSKRKYEDSTTPPPPTTSTGPRRPTGFSAPISPPDNNNNNNKSSSYNSVPPPAMDQFQLAKQRAQEIASRLYNNTTEPKRPRTESNGSDDSNPNDYGSGYHQASSALPVPYGFQGSTGGGGGGFQGGTANNGSSKKIEIPNGRVGVIIGKGGETIKYLQSQSGGAKIQVTRDMDADPHSLTRLVEIMGTSDQISKAEQLIQEVLAEAESGGSGLVSKRFTGQPGADQFSMKVPNNKVGLVIGKGGETIKSMQAKSGARIQLIPLHLPPGDLSTERTVYIDGTEQQIEYAKQLVNEVISEGSFFILDMFISESEATRIQLPHTNQNRVRNPSMGGGYSQQGFRPQPPSWGPPGPPTQQSGYGYMQPGAYPGAPPQYSMSQPPYTGYPPQATSTGWDQTPVQPSQQSTQGGGYDYYNQQPQQPSTGGVSAPADNTGYNYNQAPASNYNQPPGSYGGSSYSQPPAPQQQGYTQDGYGSGYHAPAPQAGYGQPQANPQSGYDQAQGYNSAPTYATGVNPQDAAAPAYGAQGAPTQVPPSVQPAVGAQQGYSTQQPNTPPSYPTQAVQSGYPPSSQPGYGAQMPATSGYGQSAPPTQPSYGPPQGQKAPSSQAIYGQTQPPSSQPGYIQPATAQPVYAHAQSTPTHSGSAQSDSGHHRPPASGFGSAAPQAGYVQPQYGVPPTSQPGYGQQQQQTYGDSYAGAYTQPPVFSGDGTVGSNSHGTYDAAPGAQSAQQSGVAKASPKS